MELWSCFCKVEAEEGNVVSWWKSVVVAAGGSSRSPGLQDSFLVSWWVIGFKCLKNHCFICFTHFFFGYFRQDGKCGLCYFNLTRFLLIHLLLFSSSMIWKLYCLVMNLSFTFFIHHFQVHNFICD